MNHPDFRVGGKIFATLGYPSGEWGCLSLRPDEQALPCQAEPEVFVPAKGGWGRAGSTQVRLRAARKGSVRTALHAAWSRRAPKESGGGSASKPRRKSR
jgi:hypothetical protein